MRQKQRKQDERSHAAPIIKRIQCKTWKIQRTSPEIQITWEGPMHSHLSWTLQRGFENFVLLGLEEHQTSPVSTPFSPSPIHSPRDCSFDYSIEGGRVEAVTAVLLLPGFSARNILTFAMAAMYASSSTFLALSNSATLTESFNFYLNPGIRRPKEGRKV